MSASVAPPNRNTRPGNPGVWRNSGINTWRRQVQARPGDGAGAGKPPGLTDNEWARREAQRYIDAQIKAIQQSQKIYMDELNRLAQERVKQGQALASWLKGQNFPGQIQNLYQTAGSDITGYAGGFAGEIRDIATADAAQQANLVSGTGQEGAVRNEGVGMGDVLYGAYGWSPARKFAETGAAYGADAALQPSFAARFAADEAMKMQQEGLGGLKDFALQMAEARSGKWQLVQELLDKRRTLKSQAEEERFNRYLKLAALEIQRGNTARANEYLRLATQDNQLAARKQRIAELKAMGYAPDGKTPLPGFHIDPKTGRPAKDKDPNAKKPVDWGKMQSDMASYTDGLYHKRPIPGDIMGRTEKVKYTYEEAFKALLAKFEGFVKDKARLRALIRQILIAKGFVRAETQTGGK